jgi:hypothetical protein
MGFVLGFILILQCVDFIIKTTIFYYNNIGPKGCKLASRVDGYPPFSTLGLSQGHKVVD